MGSMITCTSRYFLLHFYTFPGARAIVGTALHDGGLSCFPDTPASTHSKRAYWIRLSLSAPKHPRCSQNWIGGATCGVGAEGVKGTVVETWLCTLCGSFRVLVVFLTHPRVHTRS